MKQRMLVSPSLLGRAAVAAAVVVSVFSPWEIFASEQSRLASANFERGGKARIYVEQVPTWTKDDLDFFLHGSMSTEVVPEAVLRAFIKTYSDLFPRWDLTHLGLIPDKEFGWPIGFSRKNVQHLGNMSAVGINCASCHVAQIESASTKQPIRILGATSHFDVEGFFGSVLVSTFKTADPENMKRFLRNYVSDTEKVHGDHAEAAVNSAWTKQQDKILAVMKADPSGAKEISPANCTRSSRPT
jgi:hypothetical protein